MGLSRPDASPSNSDGQVDPLFPEHNQCVIEAGRSGLVWRKRDTKRGGLRTDEPMNEPSRSEHRSESGDDLGACDGLRWTARIAWVSLGKPG